MVAFTLIYISFVSFATLLELRQSAATKHNNDKSVLSPDSHVIVKRQSTATCAGCTYLNGLCVVYPVNFYNLIYPDAKTKCQSIGGSLPTFKNLADIETFRLLKVNNGWTGFFDWVGYQRSTVTSSFLDTSGTPLPTNSTFTVNDQTNLCVLADGQVRFVTFPCLDATAIVNSMDIIICAACPLLCPNFTVPTDTIMLQTNINFGYNSIVNFTCPTGYYMNGSSSIICNASAYGNIRWSSAPPTCTQSTCPSLVLTNQIANATNSNLTNKIGFSCPTGLVLFGPTVISCIPSGSQAIWSSNPPLCTATTTTTKTTRTIPTTSTTTTTAKTAYTNTVATETAVIITTVTTVFSPGGSKSVELLAVPIAIVCLTVLIIFSPYSQLLRFGNETDMKNNNLPAAKLEFAKQQHCVIPT